MNLLVIIMWILPQMGRTLMYDRPQGVYRDVVFSIYDVVVPKEEVRSETMKMMVIRVSSNLTLYIELKPQNDSALYGKLNSVDVVYDNRTESHKLVNLHDVEACQFKGTVIAPVQGVAHVTACPNALETYATLITDEFTYFLGPTLSNRKRQSNRLHVLTRISSKLRRNTDFPKFVGSDEYEQQPSSRRQVPWKPLLRIGRRVTGARLRSRSKREAEDDLKYIETGVFADRALYDLAFKKEGKDGVIKYIISYVMSMLHQVQLIYSYRSMTAAKFKIVIVNLAVLVKAKTSPPPDPDADKYLESFCSWQCEHTKNGTHWDHAILLTGLDIFRIIGGKKDKNVLGIAHKDSICTCDTSCSINEGLEADAGFIIAHELGHSLGLNNDGAGNECQQGKSIMSNKFGESRTGWSECSNEEIRKAAANGLYKCLENAAKPSKDIVDIDKRTSLPGQTISAEQQCKMALGGDHKPHVTNKAPFNDICKGLWCASKSRATIAHPALDGTACSSEKWCREGACVDKE